MSLFRPHNRFLVEHCYRRADQDQPDGSSAVPAADGPTPGTHLGWQAGAGATADHSKGSKWYREIYIYMIW